MNHGRVEDFAESVLFLKLCVRIALRMLVTDARNFGAVVGGRTVPCKT